MSAETTGLGSRGGDEAFTTGAEGMVQCATATAQKNMSPSTALISNLNSWPIHLNSINVTE